MQPIREYPKCLYNKDGATVVVADAEEEDRFGIAYQYNPAGALTAKGEALAKADKAQKAKS